MLLLIIQDICIHPVQFLPSVGVDGFSVSTTPLATLALRAAIRLRASSNCISLSELSLITNVTK